MGKLDSFFKPKSVAIVGASSKEGKIGHTILRNLVQSGYKGRIYPINPVEFVYEGHRSYASLSAVPERDIDLAVISIPAKYALEAVEECGKCGVKNLVMITAGFKEVGGEGVDSEKKFVELCKKYGMNALGPNCWGMLDTHTPIDVTFSADPPLKGEIAFISQSGALCVSILDWCTEKGIGFSQFISLGNKAVLNEADFILHAASDPNSKVIMLYIEDVCNGQQFLEAAREAAKSKPVIIFKAGTSAAGALAASSHTGALAGSDRAYDTAFRQCGVIRANTMTELFDLALAFITQPIPAGDGVVVVTNSGGPGIIATDTVENLGLTMTRFTEKTKETLKTGLPAEANMSNPIDMIAGADAPRYKFTLETTLADPTVHSAIVLLVPVNEHLAEDVAEVVTEVKAKFPDKPILASFMGGKLIAQGSKNLFAGGTPTYAFPEPAVSVIKGLRNYATMRDKLREYEPLSVPDVDRERVRAIFDAVRADNRRVLLGSEAAAVAEAYGISAAPTRLATTAKEARALADELGYPVVLKVASPKIIHKTDIGGVKVNLKNGDAVADAFAEIAANAKKHHPDVVIHGIEVQKMMPEGSQLLIGLTTDPQFGPMLAFGMGGIYVNLIEDVSFRLVSALTKRDLAEMITETKAYKLIKGFRGADPLDQDKIIDTLARVAQLAKDFPAIAEMDINPLFAYPDGVSALDVKITLSDK